MKTTPLCSFAPQRPLASGSTTPGRPRQVRGAVQTLLQSLRARTPRPRRLAWAFLWWGLLFGAGTTRAWIYQNSSEFQSDGDFDGNGLRDLVIVDRATGSYRVGYQLTPSNYVWAAARASGIQNVNSLALGRLQTLTWDSFAFTAPEANRVNLLEASNPGAAGLPLTLFLTNVGPNMVGAIDIGGVGNTLHDDLCIVSIYSSNSPNRETLVRSTGGSLAVLADNAIPTVREEANRVVLNTNETPRLAWLARATSAGVDTLQVSDFSSGVAVQNLSIGISTVAGPPKYLLGQFATTNRLSQMILYWLNSTWLYWYQVVEPSPGVYGFSFVNANAYTNTIDQVFMLPGTNGTKLLLQFGDGSQAAVYSFDGVNPPVLVQQFTPEPGEHFTGAGVLGGSSFTAYSAPLGQRTSSKFKTWNWNGSGYTAGAAGDLPRVSAFSAAGNVLQFRFEPFVTNQPILLRLNNAGDWASQIKFSGSPSNITVQTESFLTPTQGLANPTPLALGKSHPLAQYGLGNQYSNPISLFSFQPAAGDKISEVTIAPTPGAYNSALVLQFAASNPSDLIFFRVGLGGTWVQFTGQTVRLFTNALVQYYGQPGPGAPKSVIKSATYTFATAPGQLDSNHDGLPDFVAIAKGLDPNGGRDSDGDGFSDLEELLHRTNPLDKTSYPTTNLWPANKLHIDDQAVFDLLVLPRPWDGYSNRATLCATGAVVSAFDLQGSSLGSATVGSNAWPLARLSNIVVNPDARLVTMATEQHYSLLTTNTNNTVGRELLGLIAVPALAALNVPYVYGGANITNDANNWILAASNAWWNQTRAVLNHDLTVNDTLTALLVERALAQVLGARGTNWWTNLTLFPFRVSDLGRVNPAQATLLGLETVASPVLPAYKLQALQSTISNWVETSVVPAVTNLRWVVQDIYRINSLLNNDFPATFASPVDEIRVFLWSGRLDSNYLFWAASAPALASASNGAVLILNQVAPRPTTNVTLMVRADSFSGSCRVLDPLGGGTPWALLNDSGLPFSFPGNFDLVPGALLQVAGYTDVTNPACAWRFMQVTNMALLSVPVAGDNDLNGNLLLDSWEQEFFGRLGLDPFADSDGDGYSNLQEMLGGSDPSDPLSTPVGPPVAFAPPTLVLVPAGANVQLLFDWPAGYLNQFVFGVRSTAAIGTSFHSESVGLPLAVGGNWYQLTLPAPADPSHFYYLSVALAPLGP